MKIPVFVSIAVFASFAGVSSGTFANEINQRVANAYNEGVVRCSNPECARYLYACFKSYGSASLNDFLACGSLASRLNNDVIVVAPAAEQTAQNLR